MQDEPEHLGRDARMPTARRRITASAGSGRRRRRAPARDGPQPDQNAPCRARSLTAAGPRGLAYVYALGRIEPRFPDLAVEKEFAQATGRVRRPPG